jgi:class 3 adenylate cyclase
VVNTSRFFAFTEVEIEDPQGRQIGHAAGQSAIRPIAPPPPPPPAELPPIEEPRYATPDPTSRPVAGNLPPDAWEENDGLTVVRMFADRTRMWPLFEFLGMRFLEVAEGRTVCTIPASEWFCGFSRRVASGVVVALTFACGGYAGVAGRRKGEGFVGLDHYAQFRSLVAPDGRLLRAEARAQRISGDLCEFSVSVHDADGVVVARAEGSGAYIEASRRQRRSAPEAKRILATLLFTDIVGSTEHAKRLGDARWRALLDQHRAAVRTELARCGGIEIDTAGDGFFARFDSPARALECARAAREAVRRLGLEIRAGIHTGECELAGGKLSGMAVHIAARVQAAAPPGEIRVSGTVKDLAVGSAWRFADRGEHTLKGVPGEWRLYALEEP